MLLKLGIKVFRTRAAVFFFSCTGPDNNYLGFVGNTVCRNYPNSMLWYKSNHRQCKQLSASVFE